MRDSRDFADVSLVRLLDELCQALLCEVEKRLHHHGEHFVASDAAKNVERGLGVEGDLRHAEDVGDGSVSHRGGWSRNVALMYGLSPTERHRRTLVRAHRT